MKKKTNNSRQKNFFCYEQDCHETLFFSSHQRPQSKIATIPGFLSHYQSAF